jgi:hypothetical protein
MPEIGWEAGDMPSPWPWPTDSREDRVRRVALAYRQLIDLVLAGRIDDLLDARDKLDERWSELGQGWVRPTYAPLDPEAWLTPAELAELLYIDPHALRNWHRRGHIRRIQNGDSFTYNVGDVMSYYAARHRR